jgi:hypothetical protein
VTWDEVDDYVRWLEARNAKLEAVAKVCRKDVHGHPANCLGEMCRALVALDAHVDRA